MESFLSLLAYPHRESLNKIFKKSDKPKIVNIVATGQFSKELNIEALYHSLDVKEKVYEPETYPALLVKVGENRYHVTLYSNGKYIIAGTRSKKQLIEAYNEIYKKLRAAKAL